MHIEPLYHTVFRDILEVPHDLLAVFFSPEAAALGFWGGLLLFGVFSFENRVAYSIPGGNYLLYKKTTLQLLANLELKGFS